MSFTNYEQLYSAAFKGDIREIERLVQEGAEINHGDERQGKTALMFACREGNLDTVKFLIECGANVHDRDEAGRNALYYAIYNCITPQILEYLIEKGGYVNSQDNDFLTPLSYTISNYSGIEFIKVLLKHGGVPHAPHTVLTYAATEGKLHVVKYLISIGKDINEFNKMNRTPLMCAAYHSNCAVAEFLLLSGANVYETNIGGQTALSLASGEKMKNLIKTWMKEDEI